MRARADASIDMRLVNGMDYRQTFQRLFDHVRQQGFFVTETEPAADVLRSHPRVARIVRDLARTPCEHRWICRSRGTSSARWKSRTGRGQAADDGRKPAARGHVRTFDTPVINIHLSNLDDNNHSANENLRLQNLRDGIETMAMLLQMRRLGRTQALSVSVECREHE